MVHQIVTCNCSLFVSSVRVGGPNVTAAWIVAQANRFYPNSGRILKPFNRPWSTQISTNSLHNGINSADRFLESANTIFKGLYLNCDQRIAVAANYCYKLAWRDVSLADDNIIYVQEIWVDNNLRNPLEGLNFSTVADNRISPTQSLPRYLKWLQITSC